MNFDIIIIGAGPTGLALACSLSKTNLKIAVVEKLPRVSFSKPQYDGREIALTHRSVKILKKLGAWSFIPSSSISLVKEARIKDGTSAYFLHFDHKKTNRDSLGYIISNQEIRKALFKKFKKISNVKLFINSEVFSILNNKNFATVNLSNKKILKSSLVVAADGRLSKLRKKNRRDKKKKRIKKFEKRLKIKMKNKYELILPRLKILYNEHISNNISHRQI